MKVIGIIVEYNPLHNGHVYHFNEVKSKAKADVVIAVMSGNISMRGEISVFNKFDKTSLALEMGVDLIIELPTIFAMQNADKFSYYSILFLNNLKVDEIWIGSENNNTTDYKQYIDVMSLDSYNDEVKLNLSTGLSYKQATNEALKSHNLPELLSNDTLGLAYYKAILKINPSINLKTIKRVANQYLDKNITNIFSSAKAIRNNENQIKDFIPPYVYDLYQDKGFFKQETIFNYLKLAIITYDHLDSIFLCEEGFENSLAKIIKYNNYDDFFSSLKTKRYTDSRINRIIWNTLLNITKEDLKIASDDNLDFVRVLGYNTIGKHYLNSIKKDLKIYTNLKHNINIIFDIELKITLILDTIYNLNNFSLEQKGPIFK